MNNNKIDWEYLIIDTRARVYLLWAFLATFGFAATHYYQMKLINGLWAVISVIGVYYMAKVMPLKVRQMKHIFAVWSVTILAGMVVSGLVFYLSNDVTGYLIGRLGAFWMVLLAAGYAANGIVDRPAGWYYFAAALHLIFGLLCFMSDLFLPGQYLLAAVISAWSMLYLWLYRTA